MKNLLKKGMATLAIATFIFSVSACGGPSFCDCLDIANLDESEAEACAEKLADMTFNEIQEATEDCE